MSMEFIDRFNELNKGPVLPLSQKTPVSSKLGHHNVDDTDTESDADDDQVTHPTSTWKVSRTLYFIVFNFLL